MKKKIEYYLLLSFAKLFWILGIKTAKKLAAPLSTFVYHVIPIRKNVVKLNLSKAFPEKSETEINKLVRSNYKNSILTLIEFVCFKKMSRDQILDLVTVNEDDINMIINSVTDNKGSILLTAHFGNWELAAHWIGIKFNTSLGVLVKNQSNQYVTEFVRSLRESFGNKSITIGSSVKELLKILKTGGFVGIVGDQRGPREAERVKFFGLDTAFYHGTSTIALKSKVPVFMLMCARQKNGKFIGYIEELSFKNLPENKEQQVVEITQRYISTLEKYVRKYPDQLFWMHNIWKY